MNIISTSHTDPILQQYVQYEVCPNQSDEVDKLKDQLECLNDCYKQTWIDRDEWQYAARQIQTKYYDTINELDDMKARIAFEPNQWWVEALESINSYNPLSENQYRAIRIAINAVRVAYADSKLKAEDTEWECPGCGRIANHTFVIAHGHTIPEAEDTDGGSRAGYECPKCGQSDCRGCGPYQSIDLCPCPICGKPWSEHINGPSLVSGNPVKVCPK